jgi:8-oxo-dGTP pyrophosphatase MutT (NUDIX family)
MVAFETICANENKTFYTSRGKPVTKPDGVPIHKRVSIYAIIRDQQGRVLFVRSSEDSPWELPGGEIEGSELFKETLKRECLEETGLNIHSCTPFEAKPHGQGYLAGSDGNFYNSFHHFYIAHIADCQAKPKPEMETEWIQPTDLGDNQCKPIFHSILHVLRARY